MDTNGHEFRRKNLRFVLTGLRGLDVSRSPMKSARSVCRDEADSSDKGRPTTRFGTIMSRIIRSRWARIRKVGLIRIIAATIFAWAGPGQAHPGVGIVRDSRGQVFYTDLANIWQLAPDGTKSIAVSNVHSHELSIDTEDNLYGEHLWYEGEKTGKWGHYVWKRTPAGRVEKMIPAREGFLNEYGFVRDKAGNVYWADRETKGGATIRKRTPDGMVRTVIHSGAFRDIGFMASSPDGTLYLNDRSDLIRIGADGRRDVMAKRLSGDSFSRSQRHEVQGICALDTGDVWVAVYERREVKRISRDGKVRVVARSTAPFRPTGVLATTDGHLWILEESMPSKARVRHILPDGKDLIF